MRDEASSRPAVLSRLGPARRLLVALAALGAADAMTALAEAQEDHAASRTIGDTTFMLPALADSAFVLTEFGFRQGISYQVIPDYPVAALGRYEVSWVALDERLCGRRGLRGARPGHSEPRVRGGRTELLRQGRCGLASLPQ